MPTRALALVLGVREVSRSATTEAEARRSVLPVCANVLLLLWAFGATTACGPRHIATRPPDPAPALVAETSDMTAP